MNIGINYWSCLLVLLIGPTYWSCLLVLLIGLYSAACSKTGNQSSNQNQTRSNYSRLQKSGFGYSYPSVATKEPQKPALIARRNC